MNIFQFMSDSPVLTFLLIYITLRYAFRCWNRTMRAINIKNHGWPPAHCDADGDFKPEPEADETQSR